MNDVNLVGDLHPPITRSFHRGPPYRQRHHTERTAITVISTTDSGINKLSAGRWRLKAALKTRQQGAGAS